MLTKQIPRIRRTYTNNGFSTIFHGTDVKLQYRDISVDGVVYSVPQHIQRKHPNPSNPSALGHWIVRFGSREFYFHDRRYGVSTAESLNQAMQFLIKWITTDPRDIPARERAESNIKNVEFGIAGIQCEWYQTKAGTWNLTIRYITERDYKSVSFSKSLKGDQVTEAAVSGIVGYLAYIKHICEVNPDMTSDTLRQVWKRIVSGEYSKPLAVSLLDHTMDQIQDNLEMRQKMTSGEGFDNPYTNQYVR